MEGRGLEVKEGEFALKCRIAFHVKSALCAVPWLPPHTPALSELDKCATCLGAGGHLCRGSWGCVCAVCVLGAGCRLSSAGLAGVLGSAESASSAAWDRAERSAPFIFCPRSYRNLVPVSVGAPYRESAARLTPSDALCD